MFSGLYDLEQRSNYFIGVTDVSSSISLKNSPCKYP